MIRGVVHAYDKCAVSQAGEIQIDKARWVESPVQKFEEKAVARGAILTYAEGRVHLEVLALWPADRQDDYEYKIICGVLKPATRRAFKLLQVLPWWQRKDAEARPSQA
jgi:hypothetical protein